jgi:pimeloyl-ACP methyl ester carboxylesterase
MILSVPEPVISPHIRQIRLETGKESVDMWLLEADARFERPCPAVIFAHGNAELIDFWPEYLDRFQHIGIHLLLVEYPGYGRSTGRPSETSITRVLTAAYDRLISLEQVDSRRIILFGRSIGGGAVCSLAKVRPSAAIILMSTFTGIRYFAIRYGLPSALVRDPMDNLGFLQNYEQPVLVLHGRHDEIIPYSHALLLLSASPKASLISWECGHNDCPPDWEDFWKEVVSFLGQWELVPMDPNTSPASGENRGKEPGMDRTGYKR